jgi:hypothetical protein
MPYLFIIPIILVVIVVLILAFGGFGVRGMRQRQQTLREEAVTHQVETLTYRVPVGQDPTAVIHALQQEGFNIVRDDAASDPQELLILCPAGADRERARVRAVIAHQSTIDMEGHPMPEHEVHFADERRAG